MQLARRRRISSHVYRLAGSRIPLWQDAQVVPKEVLLEHGYFPFLPRELFSIMPYLICLVGCAAA